MTGVSPLRNYGHFSRSREHNFIALTLVITDIDQHLGNIKFELSQIIMYHSSSFSVRLCLRTFKKVFNGSISVFFITKGHSNVAHQFSILGDKVLLEYHLCRLLRATKAGWRVYKVNKVLTLIVCKNCRTAIGHWRQYTVIPLISKIYFLAPRYYGFSLLGTLNGGPGGCLQ